MYVLIVRISNFKNIKICISTVFVFKQITVMFTAYCKVNLDLR